MRNARLQIHLCVLLWGFTAILGKLITLPAPALVLWRMLLVTSALLLVRRVRRGLRVMPPKLMLVYGGIGVIVAMHWLTFYGAIKLANASVAVTCMALGSVFLALVEPWIAGRAFDPRELLLGVAIVPGVALVVGGIPDAMHAGLLVAMLSALLVALFGALNKRFIARAEPLTVTCLEMGAGLLALLALSPLLPPGQSMFILPAAGDAGLLLVLSMVCTLLPFSLSLVALRELTAFEAQLAVNLEPVYAILLAVLLLQEQRELGDRFYLGVTVILAAIFLQPVLQRRRRAPGAQTPLR
jgi:drug/metabolite transporter (DMT)-like permease